MTDQIKKNPVADMLDTQQAADYLGVKLSTVKAWIREETAPRYYKVGSRYRFTEADLDEFVQVVEPKEKSKCKCGSVKKDQ